MLEKDIGSPQYKIDKFIYKPVILPLKTNNYLQTMVHISRHLSQCFFTGAKNYYNFKKQGLTPDDIEKLKKTRTIQEMLLEINIIIVKSKEFSIEWWSEIYKKYKKLRRGA